MNTAIKERLSKLTFKERLIVKEISKFLTNYRKLVVLGIGNPLRGDDAIGLIIVDELQKKKIANTSFIKCGMVPENYLFSVKKLKPSHIIMIDAITTDLKPGSIVFTDFQEIASLTFSTHSIPLNVLAQFLIDTFHVKVKLLGIQIENTSLEKGLSESLKSIPLKVLVIFHETLKSLNVQTKSII